MVLWLGPAGERQVNLGGHSILVFLSGLELFSEKCPKTLAPPIAPRFTLSSQPSPSTGSWGYKCFITWDGETKAETNLSKSTGHVSSRVRTKSQVSFFF